MNTTIIACSNPDCENTTEYDAIEGLPSDNCSTCNHLYLLDIGETQICSELDIERECFCRECAKVPRESMKKTKLTKEKYYQLFEPWHVMPEKESKEIPSSSESSTQRKKKGEPTIEETKARLAELHEQRLRGKK